MASPAATADRGRPSGSRSALAPALALIVAFAGGAVFGWWRGGPPSLEAWRAPLLAAAVESGVDPALLAALVAVESGGRPDVRSGRGAHGLLQLLPSTAAEQARRMGIDASPEDLVRDPVLNLRVGAGYLGRLVRRYDGAVPLALAAYNAGPTAVGRWRRRAPDASALEVVLREGYEETRRHVVRALAWEATYRERGWTSPRP